MAVAESLPMTDAEFLAGCLPQGHPGSKVAPGRQRTAVGREHHGTVKAVVPPKREANGPKFRPVFCIPEVQGPVQLNITPPPGGEDFQIGGECHVARSIVLEFRETRPFLSRGCLKGTALPPSPRRSQPS